MNIGKVLGSIFKFVKKHPKIVASVAGAVVGGKVGGVLTKGAGVIDGLDGNDEHSDLDPKPRHRR